MHTMSQTLEELRTVEAEQYVLYIFLFRYYSTLSACRFMSPFLGKVAWLMVVINTTAWHFYLSTVYK